MSEQWGSVMEGPAASAVALVSGLPLFPVVDCATVSPVLGASPLLASPGLWGPQAQIFHCSPGGEDAGRHFHRAGERGPVPVAAEGAGSRKCADSHLTWPVSGLSVPPVLELSDG